MEDNFRGLGIDEMEAALNALPIVLVDLASLPTTFGALDKFQWH
jgi:hypothetical protein